MKSLAKLVWFIILVIVFADPAIYVLGATIVFVAGRFIYYEIHGWDSNSPDFE